MDREFDTIVRGLWWLPDDPNRAIRGALSLGERLELTLEDSLTAPSPPKEGITETFPKDTWDTFPVIHGSTPDGEKYTLLETWGGSIHMPIDMTHSETWRTQAIAKGDHFLDSDLITEIRVSTDFLWDWTGSVQHSEMWDPTRESVTVTGRRTSLCKVRVNNFIFELLAGIKTRPFGRNGFQIEDDAVWNVKCAPGLTWSASLSEVVIPLQYFATFCTSRANRVTQLQLTLASSGSVVNVVTNLRGHDLPTRDERRHFEYFQSLPARIFLISPRATLGHWFVAWNELGDSLSRVLSVDYASSIYLEHRVASVVQAAEGLHNRRWNWTKIGKGEYRNRRTRVVNRCPPELRAWLGTLLSGKNNPSLAERLRDIVTRAMSSGLPYSIPDPGQFVKSLSASRNRTAHGNSAGDDYEGQYWLAEGLTWLLRTLILVELGLGRDQIRLCLDQNIQLSRTASALGWQKLPPGTPSKGV
jgi:ApeA N-terminal domain 1